MLPLEGIKILDFTIGQQGPYSTSMLSDMGAEVIKVEEPKIGDFGRALGGGSPVNAYFLLHNRGKKNLAMDLKDPRGREAILRLVKNTDVVVQNFRHGAMDRMGLGYEALSKINPRLIYASATGFGSKGPWSTRPALDIAAQAMGGIMSVTGSPNEPPTRVGVPQADQIGGIFMAYGIMMALFVRERTGIGQEVDASLLGGQIGMQAYNITGALISGRNPRRSGREQGRPLWNSYLCGDNRWITLGILGSQETRFWVPMCKALGREDLIDDPCFNTNASRNANAADIVAIFDAVFLTKSSDEWLEILGAHDIICGPVNSYTEIGEFQQALDNEYIVEYDYPGVGPIKMVGIPVGLSKTPGNPYNKAPEYGEHSVEILKSVGFSDEEITAMIEEKVIRTL